MKRTQLLLLSFLLVWSCIPIVDKVAPNIQDFNNLRLTYRVQDTISLFLTYRDNDRLDSVTISIRRQVPPSGNSWSYFSKRSLRGRRFEDTIRIPIRRDAPLGIYDLDVRVKDFAKLSSVPLDTIFELLGDNRAPVISNFAILSAGVGNIPQTDLQGRFTTCRSSVIRIGGLVTDNIRVREVRATLSDISTATSAILVNTSRVVTRDSVSLVNLLDNDLRVPSTIANGRVLELAITAVDVDGNVSVPIRRNFIVNCDDQLPTFTLTSTSPAIAPNGEDVSLIEGSTFRILRATAADESGLGLITITFNELNQPRRTVFQSNQNGRRSVNLDSLLNILANPPFALPANALPGAIYELIISIRDLSGNETRRSLRITVTRDELPIFSPPNLTATIDNRQVTLLPTLTVAGLNLNQIARGQELRIDGKIEEDNALEYIRISWGPTGQEEQLVDLKRTDITTLPFDFATLPARGGRPGNAFRVPETRGVDSYTLIIRTKDLKNAEQVLRFVFRVN